MTILVEQALPFDLRILRSFRCLRPLKMVSKVPSKFALEAKDVCQSSSLSASRVGVLIDWFFFWWLLLHLDWDISLKTLLKDMSQQLNGVFCFPHNTIRKISSEFVALNWCTIFRSTHSWRTYILGTWAKCTSVFEKSLS